MSQAPEPIEVTADGRIAEPRERTAAVARGSDRFRRIFETLLILALLGGGGAYAAPKLGLVGDLRGREAALRQGLSDLRTQVEFYRTQHYGVSPGFPAGDLTEQPTLSAFLAQMTRATDPMGRTPEDIRAERIKTTRGASLEPAPDAAMSFGPYLDAIPVNPFNGSAQVTIIPNDQPFPLEADGRSGWYCQPLSGRVAANVKGEDAAGVRYFDY